MYNKMVARRIGAALALSSALTAVPVMAQGVSGGALDRLQVENSSLIVPNLNFTANDLPPVGVINTGVTGIGQMVSRVPGSTGIGLCTGSLINPRAVIFAAHCVNTVTVAGVQQPRPANAYGGNEGGVGLGFFFNDFTLPDLRRWIGLDGGTLFASDPSRNYFNVNHLWYDERSLALGANLSFLQADVAIATLDTRAEGIPTWAMLFSPLEEQVHVTMTGYGATGNALEGAVLGINYRRRSVENILSVLASLDERNDILFGPAAPFLVQSLYQLDFDNPARQPGTVTNFDFDIFRGAALPNEGTTAGGDSGGPLIVDQAFDRQVVAGVLSGGSRFFSAQPFSSYGTSSFYQPLFMFWDKIVENNPYVYASAKAGNGEWTDPNHWVQRMDPNYTVIRNGALEVGLPDARGVGVSGNTPKFGEVCFVEDCVSVDIFETLQPVDSGTSLVIPGGPGSSGFVPNNIEGSRFLGAIKPKYYDVTLDQAGTTRLSADVTIDVLTMNNMGAKLDIRRHGRLGVVADYNQLLGWTNVDGTLKAREVLVLTGFVTGSGTIETNFLTVGAAIVAPGGVDTVGTLTIDGNAVFSSASALFVDMGRAGADRLAVTGELGLGGALVLNKAKGAAPRPGDSFVIATAGDGVSGTFDVTNAFQGVLRPVLSYEANRVVATIRPGSFVEIIGKHSPENRALATALDTLRGKFYDNLANVYGVLDWMGPQQLDLAFRSMVPTMAREAQMMGALQTTTLSNLVSDRLPMLGSGTQNGRFAMIGTPGAMAVAARQNTLGEAQMSLASFQGRLAAGTQAFGQLPENMSGFVAMGFETGRANLASSSNDMRATWHMAMGLEVEASDGLTIGSAVGYQNGQANLSSGRTDVRTAQALAYGNYRLGGGAYVAAMGSMALSDIGLRRNVIEVGVTNLNGQARSTAASLQVETGVNMGRTDGLMLTPRLGLKASMNKLSGYREQGADLAMTVDALRDRRFEARAGFALTGAQALGRSGWTLVPRLTVDHVEGLAAPSSAFVVRFAGASDVPILLPGFNQDRRWTEVHGGVSMLKGPLTLGFTIESDVGRSDFRDNRALASLGVRF